MIVDVVEASERRSTRARRLDAAHSARVVKRDRSAWRGESAAIYCRISHVQDEDQTGVERQERILRSLADRLGLVVDRVHVFVDNNRSAWKRDRKRPNWDALLGVLKTGKVRHVLVYHPDRLMRQPRDLEELLVIADSHDLTMHGEANQRNLADPDDRFFLRIEVAHACRSSDDTSRRLKDASVDRARDGKPHVGKRRYGYSKDGMTVVSHEAEIAKEICTRYLNGDGVRTIARDLNDRGEPTAMGRAWTSASVLSLLDSRHAAGIRVFRGQEIGRGEWPAIIEPGVWQEIRARRTHRDAVGVTKRAQRYYLLRGVLTCGRCGTGMAGNGGTYRCNRNGRSEAHQCKRQIDAARVEDFVVEAALRLLEGVDSVAPSETNVAALTETHQENIAGEERELAELKAMWNAREITTSEYRQMRRTVEARISKLQARTVVRPTAALLEGITGDSARAVWRELTDAGEHARMNAILRFLFSAVVIGEGSRGLSRGKFDYDRITIEVNPL